MRPPKQTKHPRSTQASQIWNATTIHYVIEKEYPPNFDHLYDRPLIVFEEEHLEESEIIEFACKYGHARVVQYFLDRGDMCPSSSHFEMREV